jgi:hypothetical protein
MSKQKKKSKTPKSRSNVAKGMILAGTGKKQIFKDKRDHRSKDFKNSWRKEVRDES